MNTFLNKQGIALYDGIGLTIKVVLDSPVWITLFTLDRQNSNQVSENSCAEAVPSTPPSEVVWSE